MHYILCVGCMWVGEWEVYVGEGVGGVLCGWVGMCACVLCACVCVWVCQCVCVSVWYAGKHENTAYRTRGEGGWGRVSWVAPHYGCSSVSPVKASRSFLAGIAAMTKKFSSLVN